MSLVDQVRDLLPPKYREFAKFLVVGGLAWIVDTAIFTVLTHTILSNKVLTCKIISMLVSTVLSFFLNREWSFTNRGGRKLSREAMLFFVFNGIGLGINLAPLAISHYVLGINDHNGYSSFTMSVADWISANIIGTLLGMLFRYWSYRKWVFQEKDVEAAATVRPAEPTR